MSLSTIALPTFIPPGRPSESVAVIAGNLGFFPALDVPLSTVLSTQFFTL